MSQMQRRPGLLKYLYTAGVIQSFRELPPKDPPCIDLISPNKGSLRRGYRELQDF